MIAWIRLSLAVLCLVAIAQGEPPGDPARTTTAAAQRREYIEPHMGTLFRIVLFAPEAAPARAAAQAAFARVAELNRIMSDYDADSELMRVCRQPPGAAVPVSTELLDILQCSQRLAEKTSGAFDVTLGPVIRLWRDARRTQRLPSEEARTVALRNSGYAKLRLNSADRTVTLLSPGMQLDLGGIAKGYAADEALAVLARLGFARAMVAASGDLALGEPPPGASGWKVEIAPFGATSREPFVVVAANVGISTSADTEQSLEIGGVRYSHIVDPATGLGLTGSAGVTVVARRAALADGLATACSVLSLAAGERLVGQLGEPVRVIVQTRGRRGIVQRQFYGATPTGVVSPL